MRALRGWRVADAKTIAQRLPLQVTEQLPAGKVPGGFARDFCQIFRPEIESRFLTTPAATPAKASE